MWKRQQLLQQPLAMDHSALANAALAQYRSGINLEEEAKAAAGQRADDASGDRVGDAAEGESAESAEDESAHASEDVGVCGDFEFLGSHFVSPRC
jgi:hypothetical protein